MSLIVGLDGFRRCAGWIVLPILLFAAGCTSPGGNGSGDGVAHAGQPQAPFQDRDNGTSPNGGAQSAIDGPKAEAALPFRDATSLPAGTMITVRLQNPLTTQDPDAPGTFDAVVDSSVVIEGNTMVPRGAAVTGRVESALASKVKRNQGYVRLTLASLSIAGQSLPVQTSSLFARANAGDSADSEGDASSPAVHLEKGRRLTFRLTEPVLLASQPSIPGR